MTWPPLPDGKAGRRSRAGLALPRDILFAPRRAFRTIAQTREWLPAVAILIASSLVGAALFAPALAELVVAVARAAPHAVGASPVALANLRSSAVAEFAVNQSVLPLLGAGLTATILTTAARLRGRDVSFSTFFSLSANASIPAALGFLVQAAAVRLHDPRSFHSLGQLVLAVPDSLASLGSHANDRELLFLSNFDVFTAWSLVLIAYGFAALTETGLLGALFLSFGIGLAITLLFALA